MSDAKLSKSFKSLSDYIFVSQKITVTKTKSGKGFMIYTPSQVTDIQQLTTLAENCGWKVIVSDDEWDKGTKVRSSAIFVGPVHSDLDISSQASLDDYLQSQMV